MKKVRLQPRVLFALIFVLLFTTFGVPQFALATKMLPSNVKILLGFKERYGEDNKLHYGIDVYSKKDTELYAPVEGVISFAGRVPGSAGLNVTALTITTKEGHQVSINPFASTKLQRGDSVILGQMLGTVSDVGDPSSSESHFHLSLREGGIYKDPTHLLMETITSSKENNNGSNDVPPVVTPAPTTPAAKPSVPLEGSPSAQAQKAKVGVSSTAKQEAINSSENLIKSTAVERKSTSAELISPKNEIVLQRDKKQVRSNSLIAEGKVRGLETKEIFPSLNAVENEESVVDSTQRGLSAQSNIISLQSSDRISFGDNRLVDEEGSNLQFIQGKNLGLRGEIINYISNLSQVQLAAGILSLAALFSVICLGSWKTLQLTGCDTIILNVRERLSYAFIEIVKR